MREEEEFTVTFEELLERDNTKTTHTKNLKKLMIEVYKSFNHLNPEYMWEFFVKKMFNIIFAQRNYASSLQ